MEEDEEELEEVDHEDVYLNYLALIEERRGSDPPMQHVIHHNSISPWNKEHDAVTTLYKCNASDAKSLYIFDSSHKLQHNDQYDIGGAYTDADSGLWFYFTTTTCPGYSYLMNIFVCQRKPGMFTMGISNSNIVTSTVYNTDKVKMLSSSLFWLQFTSTQHDSVHHVKTFRFTENDVGSLLNSILVIPISIDMNAKCMLNSDVLQKIKAECNFGKELLKDVAPDFVVISATGKEYRVHKIVLAAHSPVLRESVRSPDCNTMALTIPNKDMDLLLHFLYTGSIKDILDQKLEVLLELAYRFKLKNLLVLVKYAIKVSISASNALTMAVLAEKYNYKEIQEIAFKFIELHPEVLESDEFTEIDNATLVKKLLKYIHVKDK